MRFLLTFVILIGFAGFGSATVSADSTESGTAVVTFTHPTLNPSNPRLPLSDTSGEVANNGNADNNPKTVVVDTTPEQTKVTQTAAATSTSRTSLPSTSGRTSLPQTGTETIPAVAVLLSVVIGLMMGWQVLSNQRKLAK